jgi:hypothetical protein
LKRGGANVERPGHHRLVSRESDRGREGRVGGELGIAFRNLVHTLVSPRARVTTDPVQSDGGKSSNGGKKQTKRRDRGRVSDGKSAGCDSVGSIETIGKKKNMRRTKTRAGVQGNKLGETQTDGGKLAEIVSAKTKRST